MKTFPSMQSQYCILNAFIYTVLGFASNMLGGLVSDYYEKKKNYRAKARICVFGNLMAIPLMGAACLSGNFWVAMICFALKILVSGGHFAPSVTMMQNVADSKHSGFVVSAYSFYIHIAETFSPLIFVYLANYYGAPDLPRIYGYLIFAAVTLGYGVSSIFFHRAGKAYEQIMMYK